MSVQDVTNSKIHDLVVLQKVLNLKDTELALEFIEKHVIDNGYQFVDGDGSLLLGLGSEVWSKFFTRAFTFWVKRNDGAELDKFLDRISSIITLFSGRAASGKRVVSFELADEFQLKILEPGYSEADLGWQTWPAGLLLANLVASSGNRTRFSQSLELGCGTGIVSLALAATTDNGRICITDYNSSVLEAVQANLETNRLDSARSMVQPLNWDWFQDLDQVENTSEAAVEITEWKDRFNHFDLVLAADVLYQLKHAYSVPNVIKTFLAPIPPSTLADLPPSLTIEDILSLPFSKTMILLPIRSTHLNDSFQFEKQMHELQFQLVYQKTLPQVRKTDLPSLLEAWNDCSRPTDLKELEAYYGAEISNHNIPILGYKFYVYIMTA